MTAETDREKELQAIWDIETLTHFLLRYANQLLVSGAYTARIVRCVYRIAKAYGYDAHLMLLTRNITLTLKHPTNHLARTHTLSTTPIMLNFGIISKLSALSWRVHDEHLSIPQMMHEFEGTLKLKKRRFHNELFFVPIANASLCKILGGDIGAFFIIFIATFLTLWVREIFLLFKIDMRITVAVSAFCVSALASLGSGWIPTHTIDVAIATSVLFLVPGIHLINSTLDILDSHILTGISRGVDAGILISCISVGVYLHLHILGR